jgi:hypothetical protein
MNTDCFDFARVVECWISVTANMARTAGAPPDYHAELSTGLRAHMAAITHPHGLASWPIYAGSGRKPMRVM